MAEKPQSVELVDGLSQLDAGMNAGVRPQIIPANQTSFSTNATHRGGFIRNRPGMTRLALDFGGDSQRQIRFQSSVFQKGCVFKSEYGEEGIVVQIGGRIFFLVISGTSTVQVRDVTPKIGAADDLNNTGTLIAYSWQSEKWAIINDNTHLPIFFDGQTSRRSYGDAQVVGVLQLGFTAPAIGANVNITLTQPYTGPVNSIVSVGAAGPYYQVNGNSSLYTVTLENVGDTPGANYSNGQFFLIPTNLIGTSSAPASGFFGTLGPIDVDNATGLTVAAGEFVAFPTGPNAYFLLKAFTSGPPLTLQISPGTWNVSKGTPFYKGAAGFANTAAFTAAVAFVAPAVGSQVVVQTSTPYTGPLNQIVVAGTTGQVYKIVAASTTAVPTNILNITNINDTPATAYSPGTSLYTLPELPVGNVGAYGLGRNWLALSDARSFLAGDIVGGSSGSPAFNGRDSVLKVTENTYLYGGGNFVVPGNVGDIRSMTFTSNLDTSLGQGPLQVGTPSTIFSCQAPVDRSAWQSITNPILTESFKGKGPLSQYGTINVNSDTMFNSVDGDSSLILARRDFDTWGNVPISREVQPIEDLNDQSLSQHCSKVQFKNRVLTTVLPSLTPLGVAHEGIVALNLDPVSSLRGKAASIYDGLWTGINAMQLLSGIFGGRERCFAFAYNSFSSTIEFWEILPDSTENNFDNGSQPITWSFESASLFRNTKNKGQFDQIELIDGEIYLSEIRGAVSVQSWYRPDYSECWIPWHSFAVCGNNLDTTKPKQYRPRIGLGSPDITACDPTTNRPFRIGSSFQVRFQFTGCCKFMGALFKARQSPETKFSVPVCDDLCASEGQMLSPCEPCRDQGDCETFPLVLYNLNNNKTYTNPLLSFQVACPNGGTVTSYVGAGIINYTLPFPVGYSGDYPPLIMGCQAGGVIVRNLPSGASQDTIDTVVAEMISTCAQAIAEQNAVCGPTTYGNDAVYHAFSCPSGPPQQIPFSTIALPAWIYIDTVGQKIVGISGTFTDETKAAANLKAQAALDAYVASAVAAGTLFCSAPPFYYTDGNVGNAVIVNNNTGSALNGQDFHIWHDNGGGLIPWLNGSGVGNVPAHSTGTIVIAGGWAESKNQAYVVGGTVGSGVGGVIYGQDNASAAAKTGRFYYLTIN